MEILKQEFASSASGPPSKSAKSPGEENAAASNVMISMNKIKVKLGIPEYAEDYART